MSQRKKRVGTQKKPVSSDSKSKADFGNGSRFIYVFEGKMKPTGNTNVRREIWNGHYRSVARSTNGRFIANQKYNKKGHTKFQDEYGIRKRTLTISSSRQLNMSNSKEREAVTNALDRKYQNFKYPGYQWDRSTFKYRYTYDGVTGVKV